MFDTIYIERQISKHPRTLEVLARFPNATVVDIERYGEIFNRRAQNFRLQKSNPGLIIAQKHGQRVLKTPASYGVGDKRNYYFSHFLNCLYDCRYCFLQGMFPSAHYVWFVNYEDFMIDIAKTAALEESSAMFFSGYDCDSLAMDGITNFSSIFLKAFKSIPNASIEFRTKSVNIRSFMDTEPLSNAVIAFSLSPESVGSALEHKVPSLKARITAMQRLADKGWQIGFRFDPIVYSSQVRFEYEKLFTLLKDAIPDENVHSISLGPLRFPKKMHDKIVKLYPKEKLFCGPLEKRSNMVSYPPDIEQSMVGHCAEAIQSRWPASKLFQCTPENL